MAIKLEWIALFLTLSIIAVSMLVKISNQREDKTASTKELEFYHTTFLEVDQQRILGRAYAQKGIRNAGVLYVSFLEYQTDTIELLRANTARFSGKRLYLEGNISMHRREGFSFDAQKAIYNKQTKILNVLSPFRASLKEGVIYGKKLVYDTQHKQIQAFGVSAEIYLQK